MSFEIKHTLSIISGSNWENLKHIELKPNLPVCLLKKMSVLKQNKNNTGNNLDNILAKTLIITFTNQQ